MALDSGRRTLRVFSSAAVLVAATLLPFYSQGQDQLQRYGPTQPTDLSTEQWRVHLKKIDAAQRLRDGTLMPWDFRLAGSVWFADGEIGLAARHREALAQQMQRLPNLPSPYREAYCTLTLHIVGPRIQNAATQGLVRQRVDAVRRWFIAHGYDATLVVASASFGNDAKEVQWELAGGLLPKVPCEAERTKMRKDLAAEYARGNPTLVR